MTVCDTVIRVDPVAGNAQVVQAGNGRTTSAAVTATGGGPHDLRVAEGRMTADDPAIDRMRARAQAAWDAAAEPQPYINPAADVWTDVAAEERQDRRAHELAHLEYREGII